MRVKIKNDRQVNKITSCGNAIKVENEDDHQPLLLDCEIDADDRTSIPTRKCKGQK